MYRDQMKKAGRLGVICMVLLLSPILAWSKSCSYGSPHSSQQCGPNATCVLNTSEGPNHCPPGDVCAGLCMLNE